MMNRAWERAMYWYWEFICYSDEGHWVTSWEFQGQGAFSYVPLIPGLLWTSFELWESERRLKCLVDWINIG
jgi:hypothetical protein